MQVIHAGLNKIKKAYTSTGQYFSAAFYAPSKQQCQIALLLFGVILISSGLHLQVHALELDVGEYNDDRVAEAVNRIFLYIEGSFGALLMVASGLGAIMAAAFGQYRAALGLLVVAVGAFILRSLVGTFFNTDSIDELV